MEDQHKNIYREEAYELLTELENSLIELEKRPEDMELIGQVFRSMHTIKGSGAMFGFDNIAAFTHEIETVFDAIRDGRMRASQELVELTLKACDLIKKMVDDEPIEENEERRMVERFQGMMPDQPDVVVDTGRRGIHVVEEPVMADENLETYRITFRPSPDIFRTGNNPLLLLNELCDIGACKVLIYTRNIPPLDEIDPETCYLHWDIFIKTEESLNAIRDIFIFVEDLCNLDIQRITTADKATFSDYEDKRLGEILMERGDVKPEDIELALTSQKRMGEVLLECGRIDKDTLESALVQQQHIRESNRQRKNLDSAKTIRVAAEKLDSLVDLVGELVTVQARLSQRVSEYEDANLTAIAEEVERIASELRDQTMDVRMLPVGTTFRKFTRLIHDLSRELGKDVVVITEGEETELDKTVLEQLNDPLMHIIRNTLDHDIERPEERVAKGKPRQGTIRLAAEHSGSDVLLHISGDGAGINTRKVRDKAVEKGLIPPDAELSEKDIFNLIFLPGFSTAQQLSDVSGRGVGMDVVRRKVEGLRGTVEIWSERDKGATVTLKLPLTLAITDGLLLQVGDDDYVMPLLSVEECVELDRAAGEKARERQMIRYRDDIIPYVNLRKLFEIDGEMPEIEKVVITEAGGQRVGFGVDRVVGQHQTVVKTLGRFYKDVKYVSGATILGDGTVALILDINRIVWTLQERTREKETGGRIAAAV